MNRVIVVESAAKTKTIRAFLRGDYAVIACGGHIVDLPDDELGVDVDHDFEFRIEPLEYGGTSKVERVRDQLVDADEIYLATDPDREGEAIAADLKEHCVRNGIPVYRIEFNAIVYHAVKEALENPRDIDQNRVEAQRARRVLDRLIGFIISAMAQFDPEGPGCPSVGRVLAPAVSLVVDREEEIEAFEPRRYWALMARLVTDVEEIEAELEGEWDDFDRAKQDVRQLDELGSMTVVDCQEDPDDLMQPLPPYTTDSLQNDADRLLGLTPERTMELAQTLYQGVEIDDQPRALITYMRTDSTRLSPSALNLAKEALAERDELGEDLYKGRTWQPRGGEQDAHEAIRPTAPEDPEVFPENLEGRLDEPLLELYRLIYVRFLASQMVPARYHTTELRLEADTGDYRAEAVGHDLEEPGFLTLFRTLHPDHGRDETSVPALETGTRLDLERVWPEPQKTYPPPRYREGSLVSELKQRGIGRPSTYSEILTKIKAGQRGYGYVRKVRGTLRPTEQGRALCEYLHEKFPQVISYEYTARMEQKLEKIEQGENDYETFVREEFEWLRETYELTREKGWISGNRPTPAQVDYLEHLAEQTGQEPPEEAFTSREKVSEWIDRLKEEVPSIVRLSDIEQVEVGGVECYRFRLFFNKPLPDEEKEYLKDMNMKYKRGGSGRLPSYQLQRQDRQTVKAVYDELVQRYGGEESPLEARFERAEAV